MKKLLLSLLAVMGVSYGASAAVTYDLTPITELKTGDRIVIVDQTSNMAMVSTKASSTGPTASTVTFDDTTTKAQITSSVTNGLLFTVTVTPGDSENSYQFTSCDDTACMLYCTADNNGVRISNNTAKNGYESFTWDATNKKLKNTGRNRWLGVYTSKSDWRCYTSATQANIKATVTAFYKETAIIDDTKVSDPVASVESGVYFHPFELTLSCATKDAEISYQIGESQPMEYTTAIKIEESCIVTVKATKAGLTDSETVVFNYTIPQLGLVGVGSEANPYSVADALKIIAYGPKNDEVFVKGFISTLTDISTTYKNATYDISDDGNTTNGEQLTVFRGKYLNGADITSANKDNFQIGCEVVVKGSLINYQNTTPEIAAGNVLISIKAPETDTKPAPELSFSQATVSVMEGEEDFTAPTLINPNNLTVTYSSTNEDVAIVDENSGEILIGAPGTTVITATFAGNDEFAAGTASYTLTVTPKPVLGAITINGEVAVKDKTYSFVEGSAIIFAAENAEEIEATIYTEDLEKVTTVGEQTSSCTWTATEAGLYMVTVTTLGCNDMKDIEFYINVTEKPAIELVAEFVFTGDNANVTSMVEAGKTLAATNDNSDNMDNDLTDDTLTAANGTTLSFTLGDKESHPKYWQSKSGIEARIYVGNNMTVTAPQGYQITKITFTKGPGNTWNLTAKSGTFSDFVWTTTETGDLNSVVFNTENKRTDIGSITVEIAPMTTPVAPEVPVVMINGEEVTDFDQVIDLKETSVIVTITAPEGHHIYHKHVVESAPAPAAVRAAEEANDFTHVENNVAEVLVEKNGTLHFYSQHVASGMQSPVKTLAFTGATTSLTEIEGAQSAASEWYDLQGRRVARPAKGGVYIRKQGSAITKLAL